MKSTIKLVKKFFVATVMLSLIISVTFGCNKDNDGDSSSSNNTANKADLWVTAFSSYTNITPESLVTVSFRMTNKGNVEATGFNAGLYLSPDDIVTKEDTLWTPVLNCPDSKLICENGNTSLSLEALGTITAEMSLLKLPDSITNGIWYAGVILDTNNSIDESDETNNTSAIIEIKVSDAGTPNSASPFVKTINKSSGATIIESQTIEIVFNKTIDTSTLSIGGSMASEAAAVSWSKYYYENDKLIIIPSSKWTLGDNRTLTIDCNDESGNALETYEVTYNILEPVIYVKTDGNDSNSGSKTSPMKTISAAILKVEETFSIGDVYVAEGVYNITEAISMKSDISLYGGYSLIDWNDRNSSFYTTTINYSGTEQAIYFSSFNIITEKTVIDGFTINSSGEKTINLYSASPIISNNIINNNNSGTSSYKTAIYVSGLTSVQILENNINGSSNGSNGMGIYLSLPDTGSSPVIRGNTISGGTALGKTYGIRVGIPRNIDLTISDNTINGGSGDIKSYAISLESWLSYTPEATISGNDIKGGNSDTTYGVYVESNYTLTMTNNTINGGTAKLSSTSDSYGVYLFTGSSNVTSTISNNNITGGSALDDSYGIYYDSNAASNVTTIKDNFVEGGSGYHTSSALVTGGGSVAITGNRVYGGGVFNSSIMSRAISDASDNSLIANNLVNGGYGNEAQGIYLFSVVNSPSQNIINNTILGANYVTNDYSVGIYINNTTPIIENNIIYTPTGTNKICIGEHTSSSDPLSIKNNNLYNCPIAIFDENTTILDLPGLDSLNIGYSGNFSEYPIFMDEAGPDNILGSFNDNDLHLQASSPINTRQGGLDLSSTIAVDFDKTNRTTTITGVPTNNNAAGWSIGAYEID